MSRLIPAVDSINWTWFTSLETSSVEIGDDVVNSASELSNILGTIELTDAEKNTVSSNITSLAYQMAGVDPDTSSLLPTQKWYNSWIAQESPNNFAFTVNLMITKVKTNDTVDLDNFVQNFNSILNFVIVRYFSTPIPSSYLVNGAATGTKPRLVESDSPYYSKMTDYLHDFFMNDNLGIYGIGNDTITNLCANFSRETISNYVPIKDWCGCFSPESSFTTNAKAIYPESASYTKACDPLCIYYNAIKVVEPKGSSSPGTNSTCNATLCIMSKFDLQSADLNGSINLKQNCPCSNGPAPCFCVIDQSVESLLNKTKGPNGGSMADPVTFKQYCPGATCFIADDSGNLTQTACQSDNPDATPAILKDGDVGTIVGPNIWYLFLSILLVGITLIQCARHIGFEPKYKIKGVLKPKVKLSKTSKSSNLGFFKR